MGADASKLAPTSDAIGRFIKRLIFFPGGGRSGDLNADRESPTQKLLQLRIHTIV